MAREEILLPQLLDYEKNPGPLTLREHNWVGVLSCELLLIKGELQDEIDLISNL